MRIIGLTGGIACGKSTVSAYLNKCGAHIIDGDKLSRELTCENGPALPAIRENFGDAVFHNGPLDRRMLGSIVFSDPLQLEKLNAIMKPLLEEMILTAISGAHAAHVDICVLDMPLLYENGIDRLCDSVWCVSIQKELQITRLINRDGITVSEALNRISSQWPLEKKCDLADFVIDNSGPVEKTMEIVLRRFEYELLMAGKVQ